MSEKNTDNHVENHDSNPIPQNVDTILKFLEEFFTTKGKHISLKKDNQESNNYDSGFDTEMFSCNEKFKIKNTFQTSLFFNYEYSVLFNKCLKDIFIFLQSIEIHTLLPGHLDNILKMVFNVINYLDKHGSLEYKNICSDYLEYLLKIPEDEADVHFNFKLEIYTRFSSLKCMEEMIGTLLVKKIETFVNNLKREKFHPALSYVYRFDISCCGAFLLCLEKLVIEHKFKSSSMSHNNKQRLDQIYKDLSKTDNYIFLRNIIHKILSKM